MSEYITTEQECRDQISGVCEGCGGKVTPIKTEDNAGNPTYWPGCRICHSFRGGIKVEYFKIARKLVESNLLVPYRDNKPSKDDLEEYDFWLRMQTAGLSNKIPLIHEMLKQEFEATPNNEGREG